MSKNRLSARLRALLGFIEPCKVFADVGCDHGYIAESVLEKELAERVVISDISFKSLNKAVKLLFQYGERVNAICTDGMKGFPENVDQALIAGMGGEEIVKILQSAPYVPETVVCQPMKNADKVRRSLIGLGYKLTRDTVFFDGNKYYFIIRAEIGASDYSEREIIWGRENLDDPVFKNYLRDKIARLKKYGESASEELEVKVVELEKLLNETE